MSMKTKTFLSSCSCLSKVQGSKEKRVRRINDTVSELRTQITLQFAKSVGRAAGSTRQPADATGVRGGFTVVELVIATVIAGIIIPAVAIAINNLSAVSHRARDLATANMIAQNKVESLRSAGYNSINNGNVDFTSELPNNMGSPKSASYTISTPETGIKQVDIYISYTDYGAPQNLTFRTYISELGVGQ
jgi:type II secretory pathway pseudopilin PulG